jgi:methionyl-tRNA synthetase
LEFVADKQNKIVVTAALPYANGQIHIGHLLEYIQADIYVRFLRLVEKDALYICASDCHGTPIEINAKKAGVEPEKFVEKYWREHQKDFKSFLIEFDNFYKTHSQENQELSEWFFKQLKKKGKIAIREIKIIYCNTCKRSLPDRFVKGICPKCKEKDQYGDVCEKCSSVLKGADLLHARCVTCESVPVEKKSKHYFFKLSSCTAGLKKWINAKNSGIQPEIKNWLNGWLEKGLDDWCISRDGPYFGFEIPGSKKETGAVKYFYVWLDAPIGYLASLKNYCDRKKLNWKDYKNLHHFIGKDIVYFHYLFWPAEFLAIGLDLPRLTTHGFITVNGQKMSKSRGTFFTAKDFLKKYPAEALRFYYGSHLDQKVVDIDLNLEEFAAVNNNVLVGNLGNFCYRVLTFAHKHYASVDVIAVEGALVKKIKDLLVLIKKDYTNLDFKSAVRRILEIADLGNAYFQKAEPWKNSEKSAAAVGLCVNIARNLAMVSSPVLPEFSKKVYEALGKRKLAWDIDFEWQGEIRKVEKLVEKIELEEKKEFPLKMVIGKVVKVKDHPNANSLYLLKVDFGDYKRQVVAGLKEFDITELEGLQTVFCINLKKAKLRGEISEAMMMVADDGKKVGFLQPSGNVGEEVKFEGLDSSSSEVSFDEFKKLKMEVLSGRVVFSGKKLSKVKVEGMEKARIM